MVFVAAFLLCAGAPVALAQFSPPEAISDPGQIGAPDAVDVDGDGIVDLLAIRERPSQAGELLFMRGLGGGLLESPLVVGTTSDRPLQVRAAELNSDGALDVVVTTQGGVVRFLQQPGGGFGAGESLTSAYAIGLGVADVDLDGTVDILEGAQFNSGQPSRVHLSNGVGGYTTIDLTGSVGESTRTLAANDVDGDGDMDLIRSTVDATYLHTNDGQLGFTQSLIFAFGPSFVSVGDLDGDGDDDIARAGFISGGLAWIENTGGGTFAPAQSVLNSSYSLSSPGIADIDGDGWNDLVVAQESNSVLRWFRNDAAGAFEPGTLIDVNTGSIWLAPPADMDGDLDLDLLTYTALGVNEDVNLYRNLGSQGVAVCTAAVNSTGAPGVLTLTGSRSVGDNELMATGTDLPSGTVGVLLAGRTQGQSTPAGSSGTLCIAGTLEVLGGSQRVITVGPAGTFRRAVDLTSFPGPLGGVIAGEAWVFQSWFRDASPSVTSNFTVAVEVAFVM